MSRPLGDVTVVPTMMSDLGPPTSGVQDSYGNTGTSGQVLSSTIGGTQWIAGGGTQGPQGSTGPQGATGSTGGSGPQGSTGAQGATGAQGTGSLFSGVQGPPVYAIQGTQFSCTAQTPTSVQGCQVTGLAANATYRFQFLLGIQGVGIQGYQFGFQCTQSGASQGAAILVKASGGPQGTVAIGSGHQSYMATGFGIQGPQMCGAVGNTWMAAEGIFTTNSVAGSVFGVQVKGVQATVTPAILANSHLRLERLS